MSELPTAIESEAYVLSAMLRDPKCQETATATLQTTDFSDPAHAAVFQAVEMLKAAGESATAASVSNYLRESQQYKSMGGSQFLVRLTSLNGSADNIQTHLRPIVETARQRHIIDLAAVASLAAIQRKDPSKIIEDMRIALDDQSGADAYQTQSLHDAARERLELLENPEAATLGRAISTGVDCLDVNYGGFRTGAVYVIAARPGHGKSALMKQILGSMDQRKRPAICVSFEMKPHELAARIISERTGIAGDLLDVGEDGQVMLDADQFDAIRSEVDAMEGSHLRFKAPRGRLATIEGICALARLEKARRGVEVLAIDYTQLIHKSDAKHTDYETVTNASKRLKQLAMELDICVIALAQLNRGNEKSQKTPRRPRMSDLRDSGSIEQDADAVILLHRQDDQVHDETELIVDKWRNGSNGIFTLVFDGPRTVFRSMTSNEQAMTCDSYEPAFESWVN